MSVIIDFIKRKWLAVYAILILFIVVFLFSLISLIKTENKIIKKERKTAQIPSVILTKSIEEKSDNSNLNSEGFDEKHYGLISKIPLDGIVTSTIFATGYMDHSNYSPKYTYSLLYYNENKKGWYVYDAKNNKENLIIAEANKPISIVNNADKFQIIYTVFEDGKWLVKNLDVNSGKFIWNYSLGDAPTGIHDINKTLNSADLFYQSGHLFIHRKNWAGTDYLADGSEGCGFGGVDLKNEKELALFNDCVSEEQRRNADVNEKLQFAENSLSVLDVNSGKLLWKFVGHSDSVVSEMFDFQFSAEKSQVIIYPYLSDYSNYWLRTIDKIYVFDVNSGKQLFSLDWLGKFDWQREYIKYLYFNNDNTVGIWSFVDDGHFIWRLISLQNGSEVTKNNFSADTLDCYISCVAHVDWSNTFFEISNNSKNQMSMRVIGQEDAKKYLKIYNAYEEYGHGRVSDDYKYVAYLVMIGDYPSAQAYVNYKKGYLYILDDK